jgi:hypothetical protein
MNADFRDALAQFTADQLDEVQVFDSGNQLLVTVAIPDGAFTKAGGGNIAGRVGISATIEAVAVLTGTPAYAIARGGTKEWSFPAGGPGSGQPFIVQNDQIPPTSMVYGGKMVRITSWTITQG